jgi:hypothetical protein
LESFKINQSVRQHHILKSKRINALKRVAQSGIAGVSGIKILGGELAR